MKTALSDSLRSGLRQLECRIAEALKKEWTAATAKFRNYARSQCTSSTESDAVADELKKLLRGLDESAACDVVTQVKAFVNCLHKMCLNGTVEEMSNVVHDFYQKMHHRFNEHQLYKGLNVHDAHFLSILMERYVMSLTYAAVFESVLSEGEEEDLVVYQLIREHSGVTAQHLELDIDEQNPSVQKVLDLAVMEINELENKDSPDAKLECVVRSCQHLCQALRIGKRSRGLVSADELLPAMTWLLLRANPHFLHSNINYVTGFGAPTRVQTGEAGYCFANLCSAVSFIKTLTKDSLHVTAERNDGSG